MCDLLGSPVCSTFEEGSSPPDCQPATPTDVAYDSACHGYDGTAIRQESPATSSKSFFCQYRSLLIIPKPSVLSMSLTTLAPPLSAGCTSTPSFLQTTPPSRPPTLQWPTTSSSSILKRLRLLVLPLASMAAMMSKNHQARTMHPTLMTVLALETSAMAASISLNNGLMKRHKHMSLPHTSSHQAQLSPWSSSCLH